MRYGPEYKGMGYREENDLQEQVCKLGYRIVLEPKFYAYHLNLKEEGNRAISEASGRFYWKVRNDIYFVRKHGLDAASS